MHLRRENGTRKITGVRESTGMLGAEYLIAHACFRCRKSWKMKPDDGGRNCPECGGQLGFMGRSFKAPKKTDTEQWEKIKRLWEAGFRFSSYRSHPDAEPLPERLSEVEDFIARNSRHPFRISR